MKGWYSIKKRTCSTSRKLTLERKKEPCLNQEIETWSQPLIPWIFYIEWTKSRLSKTCQYAWLTWDGAAKDIWWYLTENPEFFGRRRRDVHSSSSTCSYLVPGFHLLAIPALLWEGCRELESVQANISREAGCALHVHIYRQFRHSADSPMHREKPSSKQVDRNNTSRRTLSVWYKKTEGCLNCFLSQWELHSFYYYLKPC